MKPAKRDGWTVLKTHTPARIALGRSGVSIPTEEQLRFGIAHAQARDAVHWPLDADALQMEFEQAGYETLRVESAAPDRATYLMRPDLGRELSEASRAKLESEMHAPCDLLLVIGDGLSSPAIARNALPLVNEIRKQCPSDRQLGRIVIATQARVALADEIGAMLRARAVAILIGERPGLSSPDSLGIYLTWAPRVGRMDSERNCISNIRPQRLAYDKAAYKLWWLCREAEGLGETGVKLKDLSDTKNLETP
jgi:ethanolamine ammonia-lyase small subunit